MAVFDKVKLVSTLTFDSKVEGPATKAAVLSAVFSAASVVYGLVGRMRDFRKRKVLFSSKTASLSAERAKLLGVKLFPAKGSEQDEAVLQRLAGRALEAAELKVEGLPFTPLEAVRVLVLERLRSVRNRFPAASEDDLCEALVRYSPESWLYEKGFSKDDSGDQFDQTQWDKYQGQLHFGSDQAFHNGSAAVLGDEVADEDAMGAISLELLEQGQSSDRFNLWYFRFCAAAEQSNYDETGKLRVSNTQGPKVRE
jgi:hypothetical protein